MPTNATDVESLGDGVYSAELSTAPDGAMERVVETATSWGGEWEFEGPLAGKLILPVSAGLRRGWLGMEVSATEVAEGSRVELRTVQEHLLVDKATVMVLVISLLGAMLLLLAPFAPQLLSLLPVGFLLLIAGWLLVVARLRNSGPEEFLKMLGGADSP